ncbi:MAG: glycosyltransferase family 4 protein [bacterium]
MKLCIVSSVFPRYEGDPSASWLVKLIQCLQQRGIEVLVYCPSFKGLKDQVIHGIKVRRFRYFPKAWENVTHDQGAPNKIKNPIYLFVAFFYILFGLIQFIPYCRREKFDIIHVHWPFPHGIWGYAGARLSNAKLVLHFHGAELFLIQRFRFVKYFLRHAIRHANAITTNSSFNKEDILAIEPCQVEVLGFGSTVEEKPYVKEQHSKKQILFTGRFIERKGLSYLIQAMPRVMSKVNCELILVGDGDQKALLEHLVKKLKLEDTVRFAGVLSIEELTHRYQQCDVYALPSIVDSKGDTEGLGVVLIEALIYKKPVVACRVGGITDIVKDRQTGLLVPEKDPEALAEALIEVMTNEELAASLGKAGYAHVKKMYDWDGITERLIGIYKNVLCTA